MRVLPARFVPDSMGASGSHLVLGSRGSGKSTLVSHLVHGPRFREVPGLVMARDVTRYIVPDVPSMKLHTEFDHEFFAEYALSSGASVVVLDDVPRLEVEVGRTRECCDVVCHAMARAKDSANTIFLVCRDAYGPAGWASPCTNLPIFSHFDTLFVLRDNDPVHIKAVYDSYFDGVCSLEAFERLCDLATYNHEVLVVDLEKLRATGKLQGSVFTYKAPHEFDLRK